MKSKLKACPFCGSNLLKLDQGNPEENAPSYVFCRECVSIGPSASNEYEAIFKWNYREDNPVLTDKLLNIKQVCNLLGISKATVYRLIQHGQFPRPFRPVGMTVSRWTLSEIEKYKEESQAMKTSQGLN